MKNVAVLLSGTALSQLLNFFLTPLITRVYVPEEFGSYSIFISIISIVGVISSGRFELAIPASDTLKKAERLAALSLIISLITFSLTVIIISILPKTWINKGLELSLWTVPVGILFLSVVNILNYLHTRNSSFKLISLSRIINTFSSNGFKLFFGWSNLLKSGLILGHISGQVLTIIFLLISVKLKPVIESINYRKLKPVFIDNKDFPMKIGLSGIINLLSNQVPVLLIGGMFNPNTLGLYALVMQVLNMPLNLIGKSVSQVYYKEIIDMLSNDKKNIYGFVMSNTIKLIAVIIVPMTILFIYSEQLFSFVFGKDWEECGKIARIFILFYSVRFVYFSQSMFFIAVKQLKFELIFNIIFFLSQIVGLLIGYFVYHDFAVSFILMSIGGTLSYLFGLYQMLDTAKNISLGHGG